MAAVTSHSGYLRVLAVIDDGVSREDKAVARKRWLEIAPALTIRDIRLTVATLRAESELHGDLRDLGCGALALSRSNKTTIVAPTVKLAGTIRRHPPSVMHGQEALPTVVGSSAALLAGHHGRIYHRYHVFSTPRHATVSRLAARVSTRTIAVSSAAAYAARESDKTRADQISIAFNGVREMKEASPSQVMALRNEHRIAQNERVVLCVSRLRQEKGIDVLIDAARYIRSEPPAVIVVVGAGPERDALERRERVLGVPVVFAGHRNDVSAYYSLADLVVIPSRMDALPFSGAEAMSATLPIVATRVGGLPELVDEDVTGILVRPERPQELGVAITRLLVSSQLATDMGRAGKRRYERLFSLDAMVEGWIDAYRLVLRT